MQTQKRHFTSLGYPLTELMVVSAGISILTSVAIPSYLHYTEEAADNARLAEVQVYAQAKQ